MTYGSPHPVRKPWWVLKNQKNQPVSNLNKFDKINGVWKSAEHLNIFSDILAHIQCIFKQKPLKCNEYFCPPTNYRRLEKKQRKPLL